MRVSEKQHWDRFWADSQQLDEVYGTDGRIIRALGEHMTLDGLKVLEVGAGTGRDCDVLAELGSWTCALDYSEESLALMSGTFKNPVEIVCGDALALPFASNSFDVVFHQGLLEHFRNPGDLIDENLRVLKPGGVLLVDVPQRYHYYTVAKHALILIGKWFAGWETEFSVRQLRALVEQRGFQVVGIYGHNPSPPIWYRGLRRALLKVGVKLSMYPKPPAVIATMQRAVKSLIPRGVQLNTSMVIGCIARKP